jgi:hypothetical protein
VFGGDNADLILDITGYFALPVRKALVDWPSLRFALAGFRIRA